MNCGKDGLRACRPSKGVGRGGRLVLCGSFKSGFPSSTLVFHPPHPHFFFFLKQDVYNSPVCTSDFLLFLPG